MFELPILEEVQTSRQYVQEFCGYNHNLRPDDGQFYDMQNISTDHYPVFAPRTERGVVKHLTNCQGFLAADDLAWVDDGWFYYNGNKKFILNDNEDERTLIRMGAYICIFPDKIIYNSTTDAWDSMEKFWDNTKGNPTHSIPQLCDEILQLYITNHSVTIYGFVPADLTAHEAYEVLSFEPADPDDPIAWGSIECLGVSWYDGDWTHHEDYIDTYSELQEKCKVFLERYMPYIRIGAFNPGTNPTESDFIERIGLKYNLCNHDGELYANVVGQTTAPSDTTKTWVDTSTTPYTVKVYGDSQWILVPNVYVRIEESETLTGRDHINEVFEVGDTVHISGSVDDQFNGDMQIQSQGMTNGKGWIVVIGIIYQEETQNSILYISRTVPEMDYICEHNNRLWGCSSAAHEIYASKLGDPNNWYSYTGISTDSYAATIGSAGDFTGIASHFGYVLFFKDNMIIRIYGTMPSNYTLSEIICRGVQPGCHKSLVILNESLFYKSQEGICVYDGSLPTCISAALGTGVYSEAVAGQYNNKYYVCMKDEEERYNIFVYDYNKGLWVREDNTHVRWFANLAGTLYFVDDTDKIICVDNAKISSAFYPGSAMLQRSGEYISDGTHIYPLSDLYPGQNADLEIEEDMPWMAETGEIGLTTPDNKYISKIQIRAKADVGTDVFVDVKYDTDDDWTNVFEFEPNRLKSFVIPIRPRRCDSMKIKIRGTGRIKLFSIAKTLEEGSEM